MTFVGDVSSGDEVLSLERASQDERFFTKDEILYEENIKSRGQNRRDTNSSWLDSFQENLVKDYHYPVTEVSIKLPLDKTSSVKLYTVTTEYLEPYQNFCVNQVLNKATNIHYKVVENGDKIKFKINSTSKKIIDSLVKEFEYYDIKTVLK